MSKKKSTKRGDEEKINKLKGELKLKIDIIKEVKIQHDGNQFTIKIPKEISNFYNLKKGDRLKLIIKPTAKGEGENTFEIIK